MFDLDQAFAPKDPVFRAKLYKMMFYISGTVDNLGSTYVVRKLYTSRMPGAALVRTLAAVLATAAEDMLEVLGRFLRETKSLCLKLMMLHKFWRPV